MAEMVTGQHYRVMLKTVSTDGKERRRTEYLIIGSSAEDVRARFPYLVDLSDFGRYQIDYVVKDPDRAHVLWSKLERNDASPADINIEREFGTEGFWQQVRGHGGGKRWSVVAKTVCYAKNHGAATKKLSMRLMEGSDHVDVVCEEMGMSDGFANPKDMSVFPRATFVRG